MPKAGAIQTIQTLTDTNHLHLLVNGSYLAEELEFDDERFEMIRRLLSRAYDEELPLADTIATAMARETGLPPYQYPTTNSTTKVGIERLRVCAQFARHAALSLSGGLLRALRHEQQRRLRSDSGRRLRRNTQRSMALNAKVFSANTPTAWSTDWSNIIRRRALQGAAVSSPPFLQRATASRRSNFAIDGCPSRRYLIATTRRPIDEYRRASHRS